VVIDGDIDRWSLTEIQTGNGWQREGKWEWKWEGNWDDVIRDVGWKECEVKSGKKIFMKIMDY
jgi:hypothetical protein